MKQTLVCYTSNGRAYERWLNSGRPAGSPLEMPFRLPNETMKGDRYLLFVGGRDQTFVGWGSVETGWRKGTGGWKGTEMVFCRDHLFREPIAADTIFAATGFKAPRFEMVIPEEFASAVWRVARGKVYSPADRAVEGILTESRSRQRHPGLRLAALQRADGRCECCGTNFRRRADGLGLRCLVVHHKKQLKDTDQPRETKVSELAVVCANCHMMIHANPAKALTVRQLQARIGR